MGQVLDDSMQHLLAQEDEQVLEAAIEGGLIERYQEDGQTRYRTTERCLMEQETVLLEWDEREKRSA